MSFLLEEKQVKSHIREINWRKSALLIVLLSEQSGVVQGEFNQLYIR